MQIEKFNGQDKRLTPGEDFVYVPPLINDKSEKLNRTSSQVK